MTLVLQAIGGCLAPGIASDDCIVTDSLRLIAAPAMAGAEETKSSYPGAASLPGGETLCCMLGIPARMGRQEIEYFIEAYAADIGRVLLLLTEGTPRQQVAVISFRDASIRQAFCQLYNDLHFPEHYDATPCLVIPIDRFEQLSRASSERASPPTVDGPTLLPHCPTCLRRISPRVSVLPWPRQPVAPADKGGAAGCAVCAVYAGTATETFRCSDCHLSENIWVCMACARGGCGRYSSTHAKSHYHDTGHPFSLELATGRIWDYVHDVFVHHDGYSFDCDSLLEDPYAPSQRWGIDKPRPQVSADGVPGVWLDRPPSPSGWILSGGSGGVLDDITTQKINNVASYYESLMQSQLADQSIHYEKLLARWTVQLLEKELHGALKMGHADLSGSGGSPAGAPLSDPAGTVMGEIEQAKLEISVLEQEYTNLVSRLREHEELARIGREKNKALLEQQKAMRSKANQLKDMATETIKRRTDQESDLRDQIRDLEFFSRTQWQVSSSAMKEDIQQGSVLVVPEADDPPARAISGGRKPRHSSGRRR